MRIDPEHELGSEEFTKAQRLSKELFDDDFLDLLCMYATCGGFRPVLLGVIYYETQGNKKTDWVNVVDTFLGKMEVALNNLTIGKSGTIFTTMKAYGIHKVLFQEALDRNSRNVTGVGKRSGLISDEDVRELNLAVAVKGDDLKMIPNGIRTHLDNHLEFFEEKYDGVEVLDDIEDRITQGSYMIDGNTEILDAQEVGIGNLASLLGGMAPGMPHFGPGGLMGINLGGPMGGMGGGGPALPLKKVQKTPGVNWDSDETIVDADVVQDSVDFDIYEAIQGDDDD